jgi:hypothetical protein
MGVGSGQGLNRLFDGSQGMQTNRMLDALGLPDQLGDIVGAQIDAQRGDYAGMMRNLVDLNSGLNTQALDSLFGKGLPPSQFMPRPAFNPFSGLGNFQREAPFGTGFVGRSMERAINSNPFFKSQMETALGGKIIPDGRNDGKLTVYRPPFSNLGQLMRNQFANGLPQQGIAGLLGGLNLPFGAPMNPLANSILGGLGRMEANIGSFLGGFPGLPFENAFQQALGGGLPGSIFGGPMGPMIDLMKAQDNFQNQLMDNMGKSFELLGKMMQGQAAFDRFAYSMVRV